MTLEERAKEFVSKIASGTSQEMDYYANFLVEFATEAIKELQEDLKHKKIAIQNRKARIKDLEKQVADLEWQLQEVAKDNDNYKAENKNLEGCLIAEQEHTLMLEKQIEKMKCCANCKHSRTEYEHCKTDKHEKWEIKEND